MAKFKEMFDSYVWVDDQVSVEIDGWIFTARIEFDEDSRPDDCDCYSNRKKGDWAQNKWFFCSVVLDLLHIESGLENTWAYSLSGIECNFNKKANKYLDEVANDLLNEALSELPKIEVQNNEG